VDDDTSDTTHGACALHTPRRGTAWVHDDGSITAVGEPTVAEELRSREWTASGQAFLTQSAAIFNPTNTGNPLWIPTRWMLASGETAARAIK
jgi:protein-L-isoaspartate(D-aspartate) O-methyltransferase